MPSVTAGPPVTREFMLDGMVDAEALAPIMDSILLEIRDGTAPLCILNCSRMTDVTGDALLLIASLIKSVEIRGGEMRLKSLSARLRAGIPDRLARTLVGVSPGALLEIFRTLTDNLLATPREKSQAFSWESKVNGSRPEILSGGDGDRALAARLSNAH